MELIVSRLWGKKLSVTLFFALILLLLSTHPAPSSYGTAEITPEAAQTNPFSAHDMSFSDSRHGWVLGRPCDTARQCTQAIRATSDGGKTWRAISPPDPGSSNAGKVATNEFLGIRFASSKDGWLFGPTLYSTHDGGNSWTAIALGGEVVALEPKGKTVWAVERVCADSCSYRLRSAPIRGGVWKVVKADLPLRNGSVQLVRATEYSAWLLNSDAAGGRYSSVIMTRDGGKKWQRLTAPHDMFLRLAVVDKNLIWLATANQPGVGYQGKAIYKSSNGGTKWDTLAVEPLSPERKKVGELPLAGYFYGAGGDFVATSFKEAWLAIRSTEMLLHTTDGGRTWTVSMNYIWTPSDKPTIQFLGVKNGWVAAGTRVYRTTNGGATWDVVELR